MLPKDSRWNIKAQDETMIQKIMGIGDISRTLAQVLINRGITQIDEVERFLNPKKEDLYNPFLMKDIDVACRRIIQSIQENKKIIIYGDYDADGVTSTSILYLFLNKINANVDYYIPSRLEEGYGLNCQALDVIKSDNADLVITVDTGIAAINECEHAYNVGLDIIITDHHECQEVLPQAIAVVNPKREDCSYPDKMLAGVGVTFKLITALASVLEIEFNMYDYIDLVAIGTIADIVPLKNENRTIVALGFKAIEKTHNIGLKKMLENAGYNTRKKITGSFIGYTIAPRLNASGRMGDAKRGVELFTTSNEQRAEQIAVELSNENTSRQEIEKQICEEAIRFIEGDKDNKNRKILVIASSQWHHGVIGIVSSRIKDKYYKPNILLTIENGIATGSARSVEDFNLFEALMSCKDLFIKFGGHEAAAGLSMLEENIPEFIHRINQYADDKMTAETLIPKYDIDLEISMEEVTVELVQELERLEPYGQGVSEPLYIISGQVNESRIIGKDNQTYRIGLLKNNQKLIGIGFGMYYYGNYINEKDDVKVMGTLSINSFREIQTPQIMIKDIKFITEEKIKSKINKMILTVENEELIEIYKQNDLDLTKEDCIKFYKLLRNFDLKEVNGVPIKKVINVEEERMVLKFIGFLKVFEEIELIKYSISLEYLEYILIKGEKVELIKSELYKAISFKG